MTVDAPHDIGGVTPPVRFAVVHRTEYEYSSPMSDGYTVAHLLPRETPTQRVESAAVEVDPEPDEYEEHTDVFGNRVVRLGVHRPHDRLVVTGRCVVDVDAVDGAAGLPADSVPRIAWGKVVAQGEQLWLPLAVQGHHALMDGLHAGRFYERVQALLDAPASLDAYEPETP